MERRLFQPSFYTDDFRPGFLMLDNEILDVWREAYLFATNDWSESPSVAYQPAHMARSLKEMEKYSSRTLMSFGKRVLVSREKLLNKLCCGYVDEKEQCADLRAEGA